jgi:hypothetical protein
MIPTFTRAYEISALVRPFRIARFSDPANNSRVAESTLNTQPLIGVFDKLAASSAVGQMVDVHRSGLCSIELGATVTAGQELTTDAQGRAIPAVAAAATRVQVIGKADQPGVVGDLIDVWVELSVIDRA